MLVSKAAQYRLDRQGFVPPVERLSRRARFKFGDAADALDRSWHAVSSFRRARRHCRIFRLHAGAAFIRNVRIPKTRPKSEPPKPATSPKNRSARSLHRSYPPRTRLCACCNLINSEAGQRLTDRSKACAGNWRAIWASSCRRCAFRIICSCRQIPMLSASRRLRRAAANCARHAAGDGSARSADCAAGRGDDRADIRLARDVGRPRLIARRRCSRVTPWSIPDRHHHASHRTRQGQYVGVCCLMPKRKNCSMN